MRYVFRFGLALALGLALMAGCSDENVEGGGGGTGAVGGGGSGGTGAVGGGGSGGMPECQGPEDCDDGDDCSIDTCENDGCNHMSAHDGTPCADDFGFCLDGSCGLVSCEGVENGAACLSCHFGGCVFGVCFDGVCVETECQSDADCTDHNDCTTETCKAPGLCTDSVTVENGTACAGGTCQDGECALESSVLPCTEQGIRNAVAAGGGPYTLDCNGPTTVVTQAEIVIAEDVILDGEGNLTVSRDDDRLVFRVAEGTVELSGFTVTGGDSEPYYGSGSAIVNEGTLTLTNSTISGTVGVLTTAILNLGGTLTLSDSRVLGNEGGGIHNNAGTLTISNSTLSGNLGGYGAINSSGTLVAISSTVSGNSSAGNIPGGITNSYGGTATLINCTVSGNTTDNSGPVPGGIQNGGGGSRLSIINSTISGNTGPNNNPGISNYGTMVLLNTILDADCYSSGPGETTSLGHNIESPGDTCGFDEAMGDQVRVTAEQLNLGPLQDNGGPTMTHALGTGSVAIDQIPEAECVDADGAPLTTDQRGEPRPVAINGPELKCDVGAFEVQP